MRFRFRGSFLHLCSASLCLLVHAATAAALPDLRPEIYDVSELVQDLSPADVAEGCAGGTSDRRVVRFGLWTHNDGPDAWNLGPPDCPDCAANPGAACGNPLFVCGSGHERPLVVSFARPELVDAEGNVVAQGYKPGFCLVDSICTAPQFTGCDPMGISPGCTDRYTPNLPCMYVDFTDAGLPPGDYMLRVTTDPENRVAEADETNNVTEVPVTIGPPPDPCGDGDLDPGETCDDDGQQPGDGCDASCQAEACYTCSGEPSTCVFDRTCGRCRRTLGRETAKLAQGRAKILANCEMGRIKGRHDDPCPDPDGDGPGRRAADKIATAVSKFAAKIERTCGGEDRLCGGDLTDEVPPWLMRFPAACPGIMGDSDPACARTLTDCGDLIACVECVHRTAVDRTLALAFADLVPTDPRDERTVNRCQQKIGAELRHLLSKGLRERAGCWDARRKGRHADHCPDAGASTASAAHRAAERLALAETRYGHKLCKACGGPDKQCDAAPDDLDPQGEIGFATDCYDVTVPGGASCAGAVTTLQELVDCTRCVAEYHAACATTTVVPDYAASPAECISY